MNLFDTLNEGFFSLLSSKNKRVYSSIILESYAIFDSTHDFKIEKKVLVDELLARLTLDPSLIQEDDVDFDISDSKDLVNYVLRRMEQTGWITVEMSTEYIEILSFTDVGTIMSITLQKLLPRQVKLDDTNDTRLDVYNEDYKGYIYTIYSLLANTDIDNYAYILSEVTRNSKELYNSVRMLDTYLRKYINNVFLETDIKVLFDNFLLYKTDFLNEGYMKIKITDNINRYRIKIISILESYKENELILKNLLENYGKKATVEQIFRDIDSVIDLFDNLNHLIEELDENTRNYVNSTTAKIKFLLSEDDNIVGKINNILKYLKSAAMSNKLDKGLKLINSKINLTERRHLSIDSLSTPRGNYKRDFANSLQEDFDLDLDIDDFVNSLTEKFKEEDLESFIINNLENNQFICSSVLNTHKDANILCLYVLLYALRNQDLYTLEVLNERIKTSLYSIRDFIIKKKDLNV